MPDNKSDVYTQNTIISMLPLSTAHLRPETREKLSDDNFRRNCDLIIFTKHDSEGEYGWFIYIPTTTHNIPEEDDIPDDIPDDLKSALMLAVWNNCPVVCFDELYDANPNLKTYQG